MVSVFSWRDESEVCCIFSHSLILDVLLSPFGSLWSCANGADDEIDDINDNLSSGFNLSCFVINLDVVESDATALSGTLLNERLCLILPFVATPLASLGCDFLNKRVEVIDRELDCENVLSLDERRTSGVSTVDTL